MRVVETMTGETGSVQGGGTQDWRGGSQTFRQRASGGTAVTGSAKRRACAFCGATGALTKEHVFGAWLSQLGLDSGPVAHRAGALNRLGKDLGTGPAFARTVRNVCASCNNGWMSTLEQAAQDTLGPMILGRPATIAPDHQGIVALWAQKTAAVAMLVSSKEERAAGHGLDLSEYQALYERRDLRGPLPASTVWIGRYVGTRPAFAWVMPFTVRVDGSTEPAHPHGYVATVAVGQLVIRSARFTTRGLDITLSTRQGMSQLWPLREPIEWPQGSAVDDDEFLGFVAGKDIQADGPVLRLTPWGPAANLPQSELRGSMVMLPALCGKHVLYYPAALAREAVRGRSYLFWTSCECGTSYLIQLDSDTARCRAADITEVVTAMYDDLPGIEQTIADANGVFTFKRLRD